MAELTKEQWSAIRHALDEFKFSARSDIEAAEFAAALAKAGYELRPIAAESASGVVESGWVVERGEVCAPEYLSVEHEQIVWSKDHLRAIRCARREDADRLAELVIEEDCRVCEHEWASAVRASAPEGGAAISSKELVERTGGGWGEPVQTHPFPPHLREQGRPVEPESGVGDLLAALERIDGIATGLSSAEMDDHHALRAIAREADAALTAYRSRPAEPAVEGERGIDAMMDSRWEERREQWRLDQRDESNGIEFVEIVSGGEPPSPDFKAHCRVEGTGEDFELLPEDIQRAERIAACVNACIGIQHPAEAVEKAREALKEARSCWYSERESAYLLLLEALAALGKGE